MPDPAPTSEALPATRDAALAHLAVLGARGAHERQATEGLREISATKDALLSAISHELRTALTVLRGFAELLLAHGDTLPDSNRDAAVVALERNARRLDELLASILDLDRLGRGAMMLALRELPLDILVEEVVDAMELERVLENLLANAVKHGPPDAPISVRAWVEDDGVTVAVEHRGSGVPDELAESIFEPFERGGGASFRLWLPDDPPAPPTDVGPDQRN